MGRSGGFERVAAAVALAAAAVLVASPVLAISPQPVVAVDPSDSGDEQDPDADDGTDGGETEESDDSGDAWVPPEQDCLNVASAATTAGAGLRSISLSTPRASYPGPVVAVPDGPRPWPTNCSADISMLLVIRSPDGRKPQNVDALMDELAIPQSSLESFFDVRVPAETRTISIVEPQDEWELTNVRCDCIGTQQQASVSRVSMALSAVGSGTRMAQPQPVVAVESSGVTPGGCVGIGSSAGARGGGPITMSATGTGVGTAYPQPVVAVDPAPQPWSPPPRQPALVSWDERGTVRIYDPHGAGGSFHCVWTVELTKGTFSVTTKTTPPGEESRFRYQLSPALLHPRAQPFQMRADPTEAEDLRRGAWTVWLRDIPEGWSLKGSTCTERFSERVTAADGAQAHLGIDPGDQVDCTFELELLTPRQGQWNTSNKVGTVKCSLPRLNSKLEASTDQGRLSVKDGGDKLVGTGGPGKGSFVVTRSRDNPFVYRGKLNLGVGGSTVTTNVTLRMVSERKLSGNLKATFEYGGVSCTVKRKVVLTHRGGN